MAGTLVRRSRQSYAIFGLGLRARLSKAAVSGWSKGLEAETLLGVFVVLQVVQCGLLATREMLSLTLAVCLSSGLVVVALLVTARRGELSPVVAAGGHGLAGSDDLVDRRDAVPGSVSEPRLPFAHQQQTQAWADLMARISHELRTPLNAVIGFSDLMEREIFGPLGNERYADYAAHIKGSGEALLKSAEDTLALSALMAAPLALERPQVSDLGALVAEAWRQVEAVAARRDITLTMGYTTAEIVGDMRACRQVLLNILSEAVQRAAPGSEISVTAMTDADHVRLVIEAGQTAPGGRDGGPSLPVCVARTLLERLGTTLAIHDAGRSWQAVTILDRSVQDDFFPVQAWH